MKSSIEPTLNPGMPCSSRDVVHSEIAHSLLKNSELYKKQDFTFITTSWFETREKHSQ